MGRHQVGRNERVEEDDPDEHGRRQDPPAVPDPPRKAHDDAERDTEQHELEPEREPASENCRHVALVTHPLPAVPPELDDLERHVDEPQESEPEHPEQHPGADRACRRLAGEARPPARVRPEDGKLDQHACQPEQTGDMVEMVDPPELCGRERGRRVDVRAASGIQAPSSARETRPRPPRPRSGEPRRFLSERPAWGSCRIGSRRSVPRSQAATPTGSISLASSSASAPSSGLAFGYASVTRSRYAFDWPM